MAEADGNRRAKEISKQRAATAECVNAHARNRGLYQVPSRGATVKAVVFGMYWQIKSTASGSPAARHVAG